MLSLITALQRRKNSALRSTSIRSATSFSTSRIVDFVRRLIKIRGTRSVAKPLIYRQRRNTMVVQCSSLPKRSVQLRHLTSRKRLLKQNYNSKRPTTKLLRLLTKSKNRGSKKQRVRRGQRPKRSVMQRRLRRQKKQLNACVSVKLKTLRNVSQLPKRVSAKPHKALSQRRSARNVLIAMGRAVDR